MEKQKLEKYFTKEEIQYHLDTGFYSIIDCHYCGNETFDSNFFCPHCGWSNDWVVDRDEYSPVNEHSMNEHVPHKIQAYLEKRIDTNFSGFDKKVPIPEGVKRILENSLLGLDFATDIFLPSTLEYFTPLALREMREQREDDFDIRSKSCIKLHIEDNENFVSVDGRLYTKDMKKLIYAPNEMGRGTLVFPNETEVIGEGACAFAHKVYPASDFMVEIPKTIKEICKNAFFGARIDFLKFPSHVEIEKTAFANSKINGLVINTETVPSEVFTDCEEIYRIKSCEGVKRIEKNAFKLGTITNIYISPNTEVDSDFIDMSDKIYIKKHFGTCSFDDLDNPDRNKMTLEEAKKELTIGGEKNSSAHNYAIKNGIRFIEVENDIDKIDEFLKGYHQESKFKFGEENPF